MYLELLTEAERRVFLDIAHQAVECDGNIAQEEMEMLDSYRNECMLTDYVRSANTLDQNLEILKSSERSHRKIVLLELIGIWSADREWKDAELQMMDKVAKELAIPDSRVNRLRRWSCEFRETISDGFHLIMED